MKLLGKRKKGELSSMLTLMELVLAAIIIVVIGTGLILFVQNSSFFQSFFAKDNAYIVEAMHSVPNGEMHIGYLWSSSDFILTVKKDTISVGASKKVDGKDRNTKNDKSKMFGKSEEITVLETSFSPQYYQIVRLSGEKGSIAFQTQFNKFKCPSAISPLTGMQASGSEQGFGKDAGLLFAKDLVQGVRVETENEAFSTEQGIKVHVHIIRTEVMETAVYFKNLDDKSIRLSCLIAQATSSDDKNSIYGHVSNAPSDISTLPGDIVITIRAPLEADIAQIMEKIKKGVSAYGENS